MGQNESRQCLAPALLRNVVRDLLNCEVRECLPIGGGSLSQVFRITLVDERRAIVKGGPNPRLEAEMLQAIRSAGVPAPEVLAVDNDCLIIEAVPSDGQLADAWSDLGARLATLHQTTAGDYGWSGDYAFGNVAISNSPAADWPGFWAQRRLMPHLPHIDSNTARRVEALTKKIHEHLPHDPVPALLHGDLWGGNVLVSGTRLSALIDPACYFGHCEVDIAMLRLFDNPQAEFFAAYGTLESGHEERTAIYSLWPALVHVRLFGDGYMPMTDRFLTAAGH